jgi:hypothetical protein
MTTEVPGQFLLSILAKQRAIREAEANRPEVYPGEGIVRLLVKGRGSLESLVSRSYMIRTGVSRSPGDPLPLESAASVQSVPQSSIDGKVGRQRPEIIDL